MIIPEGLSETIFALLWRRGLDGFPDRRSSRIVPSSSDSSTFRRHECFHSFLSENKVKQTGNDQMHKTANTYKINCPKQRLNLFCTQDIL